MFRLIKKLIYLLLSVVILCFILILIPKDNDGYISIMNEKYLKLQKSNSPRIIIAGGSNIAFGINSLKMERELGVPVCNMATHAGLGIVFYAETIKSSIKANDVIIFIPEYSVYNKNIDLYLALEAIESNSAYYSSIPCDKFLELISVRPNFVWKKTWINWSRSNNDAGNVYLKKSFDKNGDMKYYREKNMMPEMWQRADIPINEANIDVEFAEYMKNFANYANDKGARVLWSFPSVNNKAIKATKEEKIKFAKKIKDEFNVEIISDIDDYIFPAELFYDTDYHLNDRGMEIRTNLLIRDLKSYFDKYSLK